MDVDPVDSVLFASDFDKAWEYGGFPKVIMAFDPTKVMASWRMVPASTPAAELAMLSEVYPTARMLPDEESLWLSRLPADDPRIDADYESQYAYWIPKDPLMALLAVFVFMPNDDQPHSGGC